jgi:predicted DNA-binding protein with PD1-like motif
MQVSPLDDWGWFVVLEAGEEIVESLASLAEREGIQGAHVSGLGAVREVTLGFFDPEAKEYRKRSFEEPMEVGNLVGNLGRVDGKPLLHAHATVCGPELIAFTGHLFRGVVGVTAEILVRKLPRALRREMNETVGLRLIDLDVA